MLYYGATCNYYPPNSKSSEGGCCLENKRWDPVDRLCKDFEGATCLNFNSFRDFNTGDSIKYDEVCCQVSVGYGFWDPAKTYMP